MKLFFAWIELNEVFLSEIHAREDLRIFKCVIAQRETETAVARLLTDACAINEDSQSKKPRYGVISFFDGETTHVLMRGKLVHIPRHAADGFLEWELNAEADDAKSQINQLVEKLKVDPTFEAGFYDNVGLSEVLESRQEVMCWDRVTGRLQLSDVLTGSMQESIKDEILKDTLVVRIGKTPVNAVHVTVEATWHQRYSDVINVAPLIARKFSKGIMNTLTVDALEKSWPREGDKIGLGKTRKNTGYAVVKSWLKRLPKGVNGLPAMTSPFYLSEHGKAPRLMSFRHGWFKACLWVNWVYMQLCRESVDFSVLNVSPTTGGQVRHLHFNIADGDAYAEQASASTVLRSGRGRKLLAYAERVAKAHIRGSSRQLEVEFCVPFERLWHVNLDKTVEVTHQDLPGGRIVGKVMAYQLRMTSDSWVVWVKIGACVDVSDVGDSDVLGAVASEFMDDFVVTNYVVDDENHWRLVKVSGDVPRDPSLFRVHDLVESITVTGDGKRQTDALKEAQYPAMMHYKDALLDHAFSLEIKFMDLQPKPLCESRWERALPLVV